MMWRDEIDLVDVDIESNDEGDPVETETKRTVFANKKSVRQSEFYQAMATGLRPELMFQVRSGDYRDEGRLEYEGTSYEIIRVYDKNGEIVELVCQGLVNKG